MKRSVYSKLTLMAMFFMLAQLAFAQVREKRDVSNFNELSVSHAFVVELSVGSEESLEIEVDDRYINDAKIVEAISQMLTRIGIKTTPDTMPKSVYFTRAKNKGPAKPPEFNFVLVGWGSGTGEPSSPLRSLLGTYDKTKGWGSSNRGLHSNPKMDKVLDQALATVDDAKRAALPAEAAPSCRPPEWVWSRSFGPHSRTVSATWKPGTPTMPSLHILMNLRQHSPPTTRI